MSDNSTLENEPTIVKHTHFKPSLAATIMGVSFDASTAAGRGWGAQPAPVRCEDPHADYECIYCFLGHRLGGSIF